MEYKIEGHRYIVTYAKMHRQDVVSDVQLIFMKMSLGYYRLFYAKYSYGFPVIAGKTPLVDFRC